MSPFTQVVPDMSKLPSAQDSATAKLDKRQVGTAIILAVNGKGQMCWVELCVWCDKVTQCALPIDRHICVYLMHQQVPDGYCINSSHRVSISEQLQKWMEGTKC